MRAFADYLYQEKDYARAITEYKRLLYLSQNTDYEIKFTIGLCYKNLGEYKLAEKTFTELTPYTSEKAIIELAKTYYLNKDYNNVILTTKNIQSDTSKWLSQLSYLRLHKWDSVEIEVNIPRKSQFIGGLLSTIIPGSGRIYGGRLGDGISSFLFTAGMGLLTYNYHKKGKEGHTYVFGGITLLFYLSDIYGSIVSVKLFNEYEEEKFIETLEQKYKIKEILYE